MAYTGGGATANTCDFKMEAKVAWSASNLDAYWLKRDERIGTPYTIAPAFRTNEVALNLDANNDDTAVRFDRHELRFAGSPRLTVVTQDPTITNPVPTIPASQLDLRYQVFTAYIRHANTVARTGYQAAAGDFNILNPNSGVQKLWHNTTFLQDNCGNTQVDSPSLWQQEDPGWNGWGGTDWDYGEMITTLGGNINSSQRNSQGGQRMGGTGPANMSLEGQFNFSASEESMVIRPENTLYGGNPAHAVPAWQNPGSKIFKVWTGLPGAYALPGSAPGSPAQTSTTGQTVDFSCPVGAQPYWVLHIKQNNAGGNAADVYWLPPGSSRQIEISSAAYAGESQYSSTYKNIVASVHNNLQNSTNWLDTPDTCVPGVGGCQDENAWWDECEFQGLVGHPPDNPFWQGFTQYSCNHVDHWIYGNQPAFGRTSTIAGAPRSSIIQNAGLTGKGDVFGVVCYNDQNLVSVLRSWSYQL